MVNQHTGRNTHHQAQCPLQYPGQRPIGARMSWQSLDLGSYDWQLEMLCNMMLHLDWSTPLCAASMTLARWLQPHTLYVVYLVPYSTSSPWGTYREVGSALGMVMVWCSMCERGEEACLSHQIHCLTEFKTQVSPVTFPLPLFSLCSPNRTNA